MHEEHHRPNTPQPWCLRHQDMIERIEHEVFGNGKPGLRSMITELNTKANTALAVLKGVFTVIAATLLPVGVYFVTRILDLVTGR